MAVKTLTTEVKDVVRYPTLPVSVDTLDLPFTAPTAFADGIEFPATGREVVLIRNEDVGAQTFTLFGVTDGMNRSGNITTYSLATTEIAVIIPQVNGYRQSNGTFLIKMSANTVTVAVIRTPNVI